MRPGFLAYTQRPSREANSTAQAFIGIDYMSDETLPQQVGSHMLAYPQAGSELPLAQIPHSINSINVSGVTANTCIGINALSGK